MNSNYLHFDAQGLRDVPVIWFVCVASPFVGFNFNDAADFVVPILILATLLYIAYRHAKVKDSRGWVKFASNSALWLAITGPLLPLLFLYLMSWRATLVIGHWPTGWPDVPKRMCRTDAVFQELDCAAAYAVAFAGWTILNWTALILHLRRSISLKHLGWLVAIFLAAWAVFACDPSQRFMWWL